MLERLKQAGWIALLCCWALGFGFVVWSASQHSERPNREHLAKSENQNGDVRATRADQVSKDSQKSREENDWYRELLKPTDWLLVLFTALLAIYTRNLNRATTGMFAETAGLRTAADQQRSAMLQSIELARQEFVSTHRPKIILREAIIGSVLEGEPITLFFNLANVGETTGRIIRSSVRVEIIARGFERLMLHDSAEMKNDLGEVSLEAGAATIVKFKGDTPKWNKEQFRERALDTTSGPTTYRNAMVHFAGQFIYVDEFGTLRRTAFRRELHPERQRFYRIPDEPDLDYND